MHIYGLMFRLVFFYEVVELVSEGSVIIGAYRNLLKKKKSKITYAYIFSIASQASPGTRKGQRSRLFLNS